jgi:hypothetical protein
MEKVICTNCGTNSTTKSKYCMNCGYELPKIQNTVSETPVQKLSGEKNNTKKLLGLIIGIIAFGLTYFVVQQIFFKTPSIDKEMMKIASELNKSCPVMIDAETRLDNAIALPNNVFQYNYTLVNIDQSTADTASMKTYIEPIIVNFIKSNPQLKYQRDHKTTINYYYKDKFGIYLFHVAVDPNKYK